MVYVIWTDPALDDLRSIKEYLEAVAPAVAARFCIELYESSYRLTGSPRLGQVVPEFEIEDVREILFRDYRIIYLCKAQACYVKAVVHGSRELQRLIDPTSWT